jgi:membrane-associated phospholipid phosphatase
MIPRVVRLSTAIRGVAWGAVAVGVVAPLARRKVRLRPPVVAGLAAAAPFALCVAVPRSRRRDVAVCVLQMWMYLALYEMPNDDPERLQARVHVRYPVTLDRLVGLGELPGVRLQRALARRGGLRRMDGVLVATHWAWFAVPHTALAYMLLFRREGFERAAVRVYAVFDLGALVHWMLPTAPPWYATQEGVLTAREVSGPTVRTRADGAGEARDVAEPPLRRLMVEQGEVVWRERWEAVYGLLAGNPLAAMPSLHFGTSAMAAFVLTEAGPVEGTVAWTYALTLGFALVYLGEHYVVDLLAGLGLVLGVRALERPLTPLLRGVGQAVAALEARAAG